MFDLEKAVGEWRTAQAALPASVLDELEEHLRSSTETLAATGLSGGEAFLVARHRLGTPSQLDSEFEKVPGAYAERRLRWMLAGVIAACLVPGRACHRPRPVHRRTARAPPAGWRSRSSRPAAGSTAPPGATMPPPALSRSSFALRDAHTLINYA